MGIVVIYEKAHFWVVHFTIAFGGLRCGGPPQIQGETQQPSTPTTTQDSQNGFRKIAPADLKLDPSASTAVISSAQKFIIPVPAWGQQGGPLVYPKGHEKAGQPILDYKGQPVGDRGMVFLNAKDKSWQAVSGDGNGVIIINEVTLEQAKKLDQKVRSFHPDPNDLTVAELKQVLTFAQEQLGLGDMYNSTRSFVKEKMTPAIAGTFPVGWKGNRRIRV